MLNITQASPIFFPSTSRKRSSFPPRSERHMTAEKAAVSRPCSGPILISLPKGAGNLPMGKAQAASAFTIRKRKTREPRQHSALTATVIQ